MPDDPARPRDCRQFVDRLPGGALRYCNRQVRPVSCTSVRHSTACGDNNEFGRDRASTADKETLMKWSMGAVAGAALALAAAIVFGAPSVYPTGTTIYD